MSLLPFEPSRDEHPVDVVERLASSREWSFDREDEDDLKVPERRRAEIQSLVAMVNEQLWIGHFDLWKVENVVMFRHSLLMSGGADPDGRQCEAILQMAVTACDRYFQAFQFVLWAGKSAREALDGAMFETQGEA